MRRCRFAAFSFTLTMTLAITTPPSAADPLRIRWDDTHDADGDDLAGNYSNFMAAVLAAGHDIEAVDGFTGDITKDSLAGFDVLMIFDAEFGFLPDELEAIWDFVDDEETCRSLFIVGEVMSQFAWASHNELLLPYGLQFTTDPILAPVNKLTYFDPPHPLTANLPLGIDIAAAGSLSVTGDAQVLARTAAFFPNPPDSGLIGFAYGAGGRVVVLSDSNTFANSLMTPGDDAHQLVSNLLAHFVAQRAECGGGGPIDITIDIKPGGVPNSINPNGKGVVPVAILTTSVADGDAIDFDPWDSIDVETLRFGPGEAPLAHAQGAAEDVDGDGDLDMVVHFSTPAIGVSCGDTELTLTAETYEGDTVTGTDSITTPGCP